MQLISESIAVYGDIESEFAFGKPDHAGAIALSNNKNPHLIWSDVPKNTKSFAILCIDTQAPTSPVDVNQPGRTVPYSLPRAPFFHWVVADLPSSLREIDASTHSDGVTARGKPCGETPSGGLQGQNSYTSWFANDPEMAGTYGGYDGPCPPFNDERVHGYHFTVFALDVPSLGLTGEFTGEDLQKAMRGHVLDSATLIGRYAIFAGARR